MVKPKGWSNYSLKIGYMEQSVLDCPVRLESLDP